MLVSVFASGDGDGKSAVGYLLSMNDHTGKERSVAPQILDGDPEATKDFIDACKYKWKYTSGAISFRDNENPTKKQIEKTISEFKHYMFGGLGDDRINSLFVAHRDKGNLEIHFIVVRQDLKSGRDLNIHPPYSQNQDFYRLFQAKMNNEFGYEQVSRKKLFNLNKREGRGDSNISDFKLKLGYGIQDKYNSGEFKDRSDVLKFLTDNEYKIKSVGNDYLIVSKEMKDGKEKWVRLDGEIYKEKPNLDTPIYVFNDFERNRLEFYRSARCEFFDKKYNKQPRTPKIKASTGLKNTSEKPVFKTIAQRIEEREQAKSTQPLHGNSGKPKKSSDGGSTSSGSAGSSGGGVATGGSDTRLQKIALNARKSHIMAKLLDADAAQAIELQNELNDIDLALGRIMKQEAEEEGKRWDMLYEMNKSTSIDEKLK